MDICMVWHDMLSTRRSSMAKSTEVFGTTSLPQLKDRRNYGMLWFTGCLLVSVMTFGVQQAIHFGSAFLRHSSTFSSKESSIHASDLLDLCSFAADKIKKLNSSQSVPC
eukprot:scaffold59951_cov20-Tisochrysis_lutea.AAC.1